MPTSPHGPGREARLGPLPQTPPRPPRPCRLNAALESLRGGEDMWVQLGGAGLPDAKVKKARRLQGPMAFKLFLGGPGRGVGRWKWGGREGVCGTGRGRAPAHLPGGGRGRGAGPRGRPSTPTLPPPPNARPLCGPIAAAARLCPSPPTRTHTPHTHTPRPQLAEALRGSAGVTSVDLSGNRITRDGAQARGRAAPRRGRGGGRGRRGTGTGRRPLYMPRSHQQKHTPNPSPPCPAQTPVQALAAVLSEGGAPELIVLDLRGNDLGGAEEELAVRSPLLGRVGWGGGVGGWGWGRG
jgi:hypothetical protein